MKFAEHLEKAGMTGEQATVITEAQKDVFAEALDSQIATKSDIRKNGKHEIHPLADEIPRKSHSGIACLYLNPFER